MDTANGYEEHADRYVATRDRSTVGIDIVSDWCDNLATGTDIIDIGCGSGIPVTRTLIEAGHNVRAIDASPSMVNVFKSRFPDIPVHNELAEDSDYFGLTYDAAIAIGVIFLLTGDRQLRLINRVSKILRPHGQFLFTAPMETGSWIDVITGRESRSLGAETYTETLTSAGMTLLSTFEDEGRNHHYLAEKSAG